MRVSNADPNLWLGDCINPQDDKKMKVKEQWCTFDEYVSYMQKWPARLNGATERLNTAASSMNTKISVNLRTIVQTYIVAPIDSLLSMAKCGFMSTTYQTIIDGLCLQMTLGFQRIGNAYVMAALITLGSALISFYIFRHVQDNRDIWRSRASKSTPVDVLQ